VFVLRKNPTCCPARAPYTVDVTPPEGLMLTHVEDDPFHNSA
jgi:hypothetical protein